MQWTLPLLLILSGCGDDPAATVPSEMDSGGAADHQPAPTMDATPDGSASVDTGSTIDTGGGSVDADASSVLVDVASPSDGNATDRTTPATDAKSDANPTQDASSADTGGPPAKINVLAIGQLKDQSGADEIHAPFVVAAKTWLATETNLTITHVDSPNTITDALLANYSLILQLNYTPWGWNATAKAAFQKYLTEGKGGWVGMHHSGLYNPTSFGDPWPWFFTFFGQINYKNYISTFASADVRVEEAMHPLFKGVPASFNVTTEEWYTWDKTPRPNVHVLANVDENSYMGPNTSIKMGGDHPVIWTNDTVAGKNVYIFMGHHPNLFQNASYVTLLRNAINWAGSPK